MVRRTWMAGLIALSLGVVGCEEEERDEEPIAAPLPVAPVEVTADPATPSELDTLRARVTELEGQLSACQAGAVPPEGVAVPGEEGATAANTATNTAATDTAATDTAATDTADPAEDDDDTTASRRGRRRNNGILGTLLGEDGTRRDNEPIQLPDPSRVLLGE